MLLDSVIFLPLTPKASIEVTGAKNRNVSENRLIEIKTAAVAILRDDSVKR